MQPTVNSPNPLVRRCLGIQEILYRTMSFLNGGEDIYLYQATLTCRAFSEPTLNALWDWYCSLPQLLGVMPDDLWKDSGPGVSFASTYIHIVFPS
jgi:hypothetical protein